MDKVQTLNSLKSNSCFNSLCCTHLYKKDLNNTMKYIIII